MDHGITLIAEILPRGVAFRLRRRGQKFHVSWYFGKKIFEVEGETIEEAVGTAIRAAGAQQTKGIV